MGQSPGGNELSSLALWGCFFLDGSVAGHQLVLVEADGRERFHLRVLFFRRVLGFVGAGLVGGKCKTNMADLGSCCLLLSGACLWCNFGRPGGHSAEHACLMRRA